MLQLLNPIWLFGMGGILIPLIIHLWNVKTGKTFKVGSIALMGESSRQNSRSLKLQDLLLLFLRCLVIILLSILLAGPVWKRLDTRQENTAWVLAEKEDLLETYSHFKTEIDSLVGSGSEFQLLEPGFKKAKLAEILTDSTNADTSEKLAYWSLVKLMEQEIPPGTRAFIFTSNRLNRFKGNRPSTSTAVTWKTYTPSDSSSRWIEHAYLSSTGDLRAVVSESKPRGTLRKVIDLNPGATHPDIKTRINNGKPQLQLNGQSVVADTSTLKIAVQADDLPNDAQYLTAAVGAIQTYTARKIRFVKTSSGPDFLFWLSSKDLPAGIVNIMQPGGTVFRYATGKSVSINSWIETSAAQTSLPLHKRISYPTNRPGSPIWKDGFGRPLLDLTNQNSVSLYTLYTRLDPEWTDLVWSPDFVKLLMPLILPKTYPFHTKNADKRSIGVMQMSSELKVESGKRKAQSSKLKAESSQRKAQSSKLKAESDLKYIFWILLLFVFLIERSLSFKNNSI